MDGHGLDSNVISPHVSLMFHSFTILLTFNVQHQGADVNTVQRYSIAIADNMKRTT